MVHEPLPSKPANGAVDGKRWRGSSCVVTRTIASADAHFASWLDLHPELFGDPNQPRGCGTRPHYTIGKYSR